MYLMIHCRVHCVYCTICVFVKLVNQVSAKNDLQPESKNEEHCHENQSKEASSVRDVGPVLYTTVGASHNRWAVSKHLDTK